MTGASSEFDLVVIGGGSAGVRAARVAAQLGARVALVEAGPLGGTCVNAGCIPKKLLYYAAEFRHAFDDARGYGWSSSVPGFDWAALIANKNREVARLNAVYRELLFSAGVELMAGEASLADAHHVQIGARRLRAGYVLVATGGRPRVSAFPGHGHAITSDDVFRLDRLPRSVTIVGGGYIALEFAGIFHALGVEVGIVHRGSRILRGFDQDLTDHLMLQLRSQGIELQLGVELEAVVREGEALRAMLDDGSSCRSEQVLMAVGRDPRTTGLGLEQVGVALRNDGAILVDARGRTSVDNIFAAGDCTGRTALTPLAVAEGELIARALFAGHDATVDREQIPTAVFSQPPLATVGLSESDARMRGLELDVYRSKFTPLKHRLSGRAETVLMKLVVERESQRVLGCHMVGAEAPEIIQSLAVALKCGATKAQFDATISLHPTLAEEFMTLRTPS